MPKKSSGMQEIIYLSCISPQRINEGDHSIRFTVYKGLAEFQNKKFLTIFHHHF